MKISLIGYMGAGKSLIGSNLAKQLQIPFIDLDTEIENNQKKKISDLFINEGELKFRKIEHEILGEILQSKDDFILSTGGGTPVYYDNLNLINNQTKSIYLQNSARKLAERLIPEKHKRPLIAHLKDEEIQEFVAKHLFERESFYRKATHLVKASDKSPEEIISEIIQLLHHRNLQ